MRARTNLFPSSLARTSATALAGLFLVSAQAATVAQAEHRELGPHQHGHGRLSIAVEGSTVAIELETPGMDVVGFEHPAESEADKKAVADAKAKLSDPLSVLGVPTAAGCSVKAAQVAFGEHSEHDEDHHDAKSAEGEHGGSEGRGDKADADGHKDDHDGHEHSEVRATYTLACKSPGALTGLSFRYFDMFPGAQELDVSVVTEKSQGTFEVTRDKPQLALDGMM